MGVVIAIDSHLRRGLAAALALGAAAAGQSFADRAAAFRAAHSITADEAAAVQLDRDVLTPHCLRLRLGALDLAYPLAALDDRDRAADLQRICTALCDLQRLWLEWQDAAGDLAGDVKTVQSWIRGWRVADLTATVGGSQDAGHDAAAAAPTNVQEALDRLAAAATAALHRDDVPLRATTLWLAPRRSDFADCCAFLGWLAPENRSLLWSDDVIKSSEAWASRPRVLQIVALEYAAPEEAGGAMTGLAMDAREPDGLLHHVVQRAAASLAVLYFGDQVDADFEAGLGQNLVIALLKGNNARTGGSGRGAHAAARSVFVAGGASGGGTLAAIDLDSSWRQTKGRDHFIKPLRLGQRAGAKAHGGRSVQDRIGWFQVTDDDGRGQLVGAPFLPPAAPSPPAVPAAALADFLEMRRAYRSGFLHWLREVAGGRSKAQSQAKFAELLGQLASGGGKVSFDLACRRVYGKRVTDFGPEPPSLEWEFLAWLAK